MTTAANPYVYDRPLTDASRFVGRQDILADLAEALGAIAPGQAVALVGRRGSGKTSTLGQLQLRQPGSRSICLYADLADLARPEVRETVWSLARYFGLSLKAQGMESPAVSKADLVLNPARAFFQHFWSPLLNRVRGRRLAILLDNTDAALGTTARSETARGVLHYLQELNGAGDGLVFLLAMTVRPTTIHPGRLGSLEVVRTTRLGGLTATETSELLRLVETYHVPADMATYVHRLTQGHPADLQRIGFALFERCQRRGIRQATIADVLGVLASDIPAGEVSRQVFVRRANLQLELGR